MNWTLFRHARIVVGATEMAWALNEPWGADAGARALRPGLDEWATCEKVEDGAEVFPGMTAHVAPGHTPGCLVFHWRTPGGT